MEAEVNKNGFANTDAVKQLQNRLNDEKTVQAIDRLLDRIDTLEKAVANLTTIMEQGPGLAAMTMDMVDEGYRKANANGVNIENRLVAGLQIAERLTAPEMVEKLEGLLTMADQAPGLIAMVMDTFDEEMKHFGAKNIDVKILLELAQNTSSAVSEAKQMPDAKVGGIFSMLKTMKDPDRQKAIGFLMNIAKAFGQKI